MRIIGGKFRGRRLEIGRGFDARPTTDFAREGLFNILSNHFAFNELQVADFFCGTGSIGLEFASRGCLDIDMVDTNNRSNQFIRKICHDWNMAELHVVTMDVFRFIAICKKRYHIVFADPPYTMSRLADLPDLVLGNKLVTEGGWFVLEHGKSYSFSHHPCLIDTRNYGSVHFSIFTG